MFNLQPYKCKSELEGRKIKKFKCKQQIGFIALRNRFQLRSVCIRDTTCPKLPCLISSLVFVMIILPTTNGEKMLTSPNRPWPIAVPEAAAGNFCWPNGPSRAAKWDLPFVFRP